MPDPATLQQQQYQFTTHLRNPAAEAAPAGVEKRRMKIYQDLVYNNIEGFISGAFPVARSIYRDEDWHRLIRNFVSSHRCESPYFLEISQEFIRFLMEDYEAGAADPPFLLELTHYEWVELALDVAEEEFPLEGIDPQADPVQNVPVLSPLVWNLAYHYPVHRIGPGFEPDTAPAEPTYLVVYRDRSDAVKFLEANATTARLLELIRENPDRVTGQQLLEQLAGEIQTGSISSVVDFGAAMLRQFLQLEILAGSHRGY